MDNLTHALAGAAIGQAGLKRLTGLGMAALMLGANLPDVDAFAAFAGTHTLVARRGWTHGPIAMVVLPLLLTAGLVGWDNWQLRRNTRPLDRAVVRPGQLFLLAFIGCLTHPLLDWMNVYGIRLLMPFSEKWYYGDALQIIDPWIWLVLGAGVLVARRRYRAQRPAPTRPARIALVITSLYVVTMIAGSRVARVHALRAASDQGIRPTQVLAGPVFVNSARRRIIIDDGRAYTLGVLDFTPRALLTLESGRLPRNDDHPLALAARNRPEVRSFLYWSRFPFFVLPRDSVGGELELSDARFRERAAIRGPFFISIPVEELRRSASPAAP